MRSPRLSAALERLERPHLERQRRSRDNLERAVRDYVRLRAATGTAEATVIGELRDGTPVAILLELSIVPSPLVTPEEL